MDTKRERVWEILRENVAEEVLLKHCIAVEIAMRAYAERYGEDTEYWGAIGLLHDIDFEKYPEQHPLEAPGILSRYGYDQAFITNVLAHGLDWQPERTLLQKTLVAVDALTGFIIACALVRPDKSLDNLEVKSVLKKMKDKAFARAINRERITEPAEALGVELQEHIDFVRKALADAVKKPEYQAIPLIG